MKIDASKLPQKVSARELSTLFQVSEQRISQLKRKGLLKPDADNKYSVRQAIEARVGRIAEHGVRMVMQHYSNGTGQISPPKTRLLEMDAELGLEDPPAEVTVSPSPNSQFVQQQRLMELRAERLEYEKEIRVLKLAREKGEVISRVEVQSAAQEAGTIIVTILQSLPAEIAMLFPSADEKREVRNKVQQRIDQAQFALYRALKDYSADDQSNPGGSGGGVQAEET